MAVKLLTNDHYLIVSSKQMYNMPWQSVREFLHNKKIEAEFAKKTLKILLYDKERIPAGIMHVIMIYADNIAEVTAGGLEIPVKGFA